MDGDILSVLSQMTTANSISSLYYAKPSFLLFIYNRPCVVLLLLCITKSEIEYIVIECLLCTVIL